MSLRLMIAVALLASALISTLELSACVLGPGSSHRSPAASVSHSPESDVDEAVPTAPEVDGPAMAPIPALTY